MRSSSSKKKGEGGEPAEVTCPKQIKLLCGCARAVTSQTSQWSCTSPRQTLRRANPLFGLPILSLSINHLAGAYLAMLIDLTFHAADGSVCDYLHAEIDALQHLAVVLLTRSKLDRKALRGRLEL